MKERLALDVSLWQDKSKEEIVEDLTSGVIEQSDESFEKRINPFSISLDNFAKLRQGLNWERATDWAENTAYFKILHWAEENNDGFLLWISPPNEQYSESRFVVYQLYFLPDGQKTLNCWSICERHSQEECLKIANQLQSESYADGEELRASVIPFKPLNDISWTRFLSRFFGDRKIWQAIESGQAAERKQKIEEQVSQIVAQKYESIQNSSHRFDQIQLGAQIESLVERQLDLSLQAVGSCGLSNRALLEKSGVLTKFAKEVENKTGVYVKECPYCHTRIERVIKPGFRCPGCRREYEGTCG